MITVQEADYDGYFYKFVDADFTTEDQAAYIFGGCERSGIDDQLYAQMLGLDEVDE